MAPKNQSQRYDSAANLTEEELPLPMRLLIDKSIYEIRSSAERSIYEGRKKLVELAWNELHNNPSYSHSNASSSRSHDQAVYEIVVTPALKPIIYTGSKIKGQNDEAIKVAIYKNGTKDTSGLFASAKVEILAVHGTFYKQRKKDWTFDEFDNNIAKRREDKPPIMAGKLEVDLVNGEGILPDIVFRDNSSWSPDTKFLIGARLWETSDVRVKEGITGPIRVLDVHGIATDKSRVPKLEDGVTRLKGVGQKRVADLKKEGINTVRDFLRLSYMDEPRLLKIVDITSNSLESWKTMFDHAKKCEIGPDLYCFPVKVKNQNVMLFFSYVYELVGTEIDGYYKHYNGATKLLKKALVHKWKKEFYKKAESLELNFTMGDNRPIPREIGEIDSTDVGLTTNSVPIGTELDGNSIDNFCSILEGRSDQRGDVSENIPPDVPMGENYMLNQDETSNLVPSMINYVNQDSLQGGDLTVSDENQVSSVPGSSHNNLTENECDLSENSSHPEFNIESPEFNPDGLDEIMKFIDTPHKWIKLFVEKKLGVKLSCFLGVLYFMKVAKLKKAQSQSQSGKNANSD